MKLKLSVIFLLITSFTIVAQIKKRQRDDLSAINKEWRIIKTNGSTYGIIGQNEKIIVQPIYSKIEKFGIYHPNLALVKNISKAYGFIDKSGKEVIPAQYELKEIQSNFSTLYKKYVK
ncbi:WG repeat-containing protein [Chryseobacterium sp. C39-AII1]|uniref:WG repeat-containing protein n=1 Tax=Chryseobacterium sp. C39-AII1 TaxID=3080332 RepID=UPI003208E9A0